MHLISFYLFPSRLPPAYELTGLSRGGQQVSKCKEMFGKAVKLMVDLATMQASTQHTLLRYAISPL